MRIAIWGSFLACVAFAGLLIVKVHLTAMDLYRTGGEADVHLERPESIDTGRGRFEDCSDIWEAHMLGDFRNVSVVDLGREHEVETATGMSLDDFIRIKSIWHSWNPADCCVFVYDKIAREDRTLRRNSWVGDRLHVVAILPGRVLFNLDGELIVFQAPREGGGFEPGVAIEDLRSMGLRDDQIRELFPELFDEHGAPVVSDPQNTGQPDDSDADPATDILDGDLQDGLDLTITETGWTDPRTMEVTDFDRLEFVERFEEHLESVALCTRLDPDSGAFSGVRVTRMPEGCRLHQFGWREGDVVLSLGSDPVNTPLDLDRLKSAFQPGAVVELTLLRGEERITLTYVLSVRTAPEDE